MSNDSKSDSKDDAAPRPPRAGLELKPPGKPQRAPFVADCSPGKYALCVCKKSTRYPLCDGSHRDSNVHPIKVILDEPRRVAWCACGHSANPPYCDGAHNRLD